MNGAQHTPGPWASRAGLSTGVEVVGKKPRGGDYVVARCGGSSREANGALIAAAPDLLKALRGLLAEYPFKDDRSWWFKELDEGSGDAADVIAAIDAIAKAEGRS